MSIVSRNPNADKELLAFIDDKVTELEKAILMLPNGRRRSVALTQLETTAMWAVKAAAVGDN